MNTPRTPREILLARHAASDRAALDAQRHALLARFASSDAAHPESSVSIPSRARVAAPFSPLASFRDILGLLHRELLAPCRRAWSALACVWLALLCFQQFDRLTAAPLATARVAASDSASDAVVLALWLEQRRQIAALAAGYGMGDSLVSPAPTREKAHPPAGSRPLGVLAPETSRLALV